MGFLQKFLKMCITSGQLRVYVDKNLKFLWQITWFYLY